MEGKKTQALRERYCWYTALNRAISRNRRDAHNRYLQLATVRNDGSPAVRTLVFRKLQQLPSVIYMVTDSRSEKTDQIAINPAAEICWYFTRTREQFRLHGKLFITAKDSPEQTQRQAIWSNMSASARNQFYWPQPGGALEKPEVNPGKADTVFSCNEDNDRFPPDNFLLLGLQIDCVDHLCLKGEPQTRWFSSRNTDDHWVSQAVNP